VKRFDASRTRRFQVNFDKPSPLSARSALEAETEAVREACRRHSSAVIIATMAASTVAQYLAAVPADRRAAFNAARKVINENSPDGYEEGIQFGMIASYVPLSMSTTQKTIDVRLTSRTAFATILGSDPICSLPR